MNILITNDDSYRAKGIALLCKIMQKYGNVAVLAPESVQSGMSMAVSLGSECIRLREIPENECPCPGTRWASLDATPTSCVKFAYSADFPGWAPDIVMSGINHGANTGANAGYSGTLGAAAEAAVNHALGIGVSIDDHNPDADMSAIEAMLPGILDKLLNIPINRSRTYYNINFPALPLSEIKGVRAANMGHTRWFREFREIGELDGDKTYRMSGEFKSEKDNSNIADHLLVQQGYVTIVPHCIDSTDYSQLKLLSDNLI